MKTLLTDYLLISKNRPILYAKVIGNYCRFATRFSDGEEAISNWRRILPDEDIVPLPLNEQKIFSYSWE